MNLFAKQIMDTKTIVGDKGIKLSGGQKQRLGLSRAIYSDSEILILDESTSALDFNTEKSVMESIFNTNPIETLPLLQLLIDYLL